MKHTDSEEIWRLGDWWQRKISKRTAQKSNRQQTAQKIYRVQIVHEDISDSVVTLGMLGIYILGIPLYGVITGSWCGAIVWPILLPFHFVLAILDAQKMHEESYVIGNGERIGGYKLGFEDCIIATCKEQGISKNLWYLLSLAIYWCNDVQRWAEDVLAGKNILDECQKENAKIKEDMKNEKHQTN